jgi:hypothetical protein
MQDHPLSSERRVLSTGCSLLRERTNVQANIAEHALRDAGFVESVAVVERVHRRRGKAAALQLPQTAEEG